MTSCSVGSCVCCDFFTRTCLLLRSSARYVPTLLLSVVFADAEDASRVLDRVATNAIASKVDVDLPMATIPSPTHTVSKPTFATAPQAKAFGLPWEDMHEFGCSECRSSTASNLDATPDLRALPYLHTATSSVTSAQKTLAESFTCSPICLGRNSVPSLHMIQIGTGASASVFWQPNAIGGRASPRLNPGHLRLA